MIQDGYAGRGSPLTIDTRNRSLGAAFVKNPNLDLCPKDGEQSDAISTGSRRIPFQTVRMTLEHNT